MELKEFIKTAPCSVHFDLSVESSKEGGADIKVIGGSMSHTMANRISFDIGISIPASGGAKPLERQTCENGGTSLCIQNPQATQKQ